MKKSLIIIIFLAIVMIDSVEVKASSGRLRKASIQTCNGITYGKHGDDNHWHVAEEKDGNYYATGSPIYNDPCASNSIPSNNQPTTESNDYNENNESIDIGNNPDNNENTPTNQEIPKSSDNTLKTIIIDEKEYMASDNIEYSTTEEKVNIKAVTNDDLATYEIKNNTELSIGKNIIVIEVTAEDGTIKVYNIEVNREEILSSDTGIKFIINEEEIEFTDYKATVYVASSQESINYDYSMNNENAKVAIDKISKLQTGDNILKIKVTAEDGTEQNYEINIYKSSKTGDAFYTVFGFFLLVGISYGIYIVVKKIKGD